MCYPLLILRGFLSLTGLPKVNAGPHRPSVRLWCSKSLCPQNRLVLNPFRRWDFQHFPTVSKSKRVSILKNILYSPLRNPLMRLGVWGAHGPKLHSSPPFSSFSFGRLEQVMTDGVGMIGQYRGYSLWCLALLWTICWFSWMGRIMWYDIVYIHIHFWHISLYIIIYHYILLYYYWLLYIVIYIYIILFFIIIYCYIYIITYYYILSYIIIYCY